MVDENEENNQQGGSDSGPLGTVGNRVGSAVKNGVKTGVEAGKKIIATGIKKAVVTILTNPYVLGALLILLLSVSAYFIIKDLFSSNSTRASASSIEEIANSEEADSQTKSLVNTYEVNRSFLTATVKDINKVYDDYIKQLEESDPTNSLEDMKKLFGKDQVEIQEMKFESDPQEYSKPLEERESYKNTSNSTTESTDKKEDTSISVTNKSNSNKSTSSKVNSKATTNKYPSNSTFVLPSQQRELYKHMLMTEKYNFNMIKWKLYKAEGEGASRVLPSAPSDNIEYTVEPSLALRVPKSDDKSVDYFVQLVEPYLQSNLFPISMYSMTITSDGNITKDGVAKNAEFAYAIISEAYSDITMNIYELENYTENWSHEEWDVGSGPMEGTIQCLRVPNNLFDICKSQTDPSKVSEADVKALYCAKNDCENWDNMLRSGFKNDEEYKEKAYEAACMQYSADRLATKYDLSNKKYANTLLKGDVARFQAFSTATYEYRYCTVVSGTEKANKDQETITATGEKTEDKLISSNKEISIEYKPYRVKSFDIVLEYEYDFEVYNTSNSPDSISTSSTNLPDENIRKNISYTGYESEARVRDCYDDDNMCDGEFTAIIGTYTDKVNRKRIDKTKNWHDKLSATPDGFLHRKYTIDDVVEFIAEKQQVNVSDVKLSNEAQKYYDELDSEQKLNRIDLINAAPNVYNSYIKNIQSVDKNIAIKQSEIKYSYSVLVKRLKEIEKNGVLPYIYGQTLGLNLKYAFEDEKKSNCSNLGSDSINGKGGYKWPVPNNKYVSSLFGNTPIYGSDHEGIDIWESKDGGKTGKVDIVAAKDGTVYLAADKKIVSNTSLGSGGYGNHIIIKHDDGKYTLYGHLETGTFKVKTGDFVKAGTVIAKMGSSGNSSGWHLHFNISKEPYSSCEDPLLYFNVEPTSSKYPEYSKVNKSNITEFNAYKVVGEKSVNGTSSLDGFLFFGDSRTNGITSNLTSLGNNIDVKGVDSSKQSEWINVVKNSSGTVQGKNITLSADYAGISVALGVNEISATDKMDELLDELLKKYPNKKIYVNSVYPVGTAYTYSNASTLNTNIKKFNDHIKDKCSSNSNLVYIDITNGLTDSSGYLKSEFTSDGLHINTNKGKETLTNNIKNAILNGTSGSSASNTVQNKNSIASQVANVDKVGTSLSSANLKKYTSDKYWGYITKNADLYQVDPYLIAAIMTQECGGYDENYFQYRPYEGSGNDVYGLGQKTVTHGTTTIENNTKDINGNTIGKVNLQTQFLGNADLQIKFICAEIKYKIELWHGNVCAALLGYNYGDAGAMSELKRDLNMQSDNEVYSYLEKNKTDNSWIAETNGYPSLVLQYYDIKNSGSYSGGLYDCIEDSEAIIGENVELSGSYVGEGKEEGNDSANKGYFTNAGGIKYHTFNQSAYGSFWTNNGCGPTSCAIVLSGLTGVEREPTDIFKLSGYTSFEKDLIPLLSEYNIKTEQYFSGKSKTGNYYGAIINSDDRKFILEQLAKGYPIIIYIKPGGRYNGCSYNGHFMTLLGAKENGDVYVGDPGGWGRDGWINLEKLAKEALLTTYLVCKP